MTAERTIARLPEIFLGSLVGLLGLTLAAVDWLDPLPTSGVAWFGRALFTALGIFGTVIGYRVARGRGPNPGGALMSPQGWRRLGRWCGTAVIVVMALGMIGMGTGRDAPLPWWLVVLLAVGVAPVWWLMLRTWGGLIRRIDR